MTRWQRLEIQIDDGPFVDITASLSDGQYTYDPGPLDPGPHRATVRATDSLPQSATASLDFVVNAPPTADAGGDRQVGEGSTVSFDASGSTDTVGEIYSYAWTFEDDTTSDAPIVSRTFADDGQYLATLTVTDTAGSQHTDSAAITVNNLPVDITPLDDQPAQEGQEFSFSTTFADPGVLDTHTATVDWGDGSPGETAVIDEQDGAGTVSGSHVYQDDGTFNVTVSVIDNGGETATTGFQVTVANLPPDSSHGQRPHGQRRTRTRLCRHVLRSRRAGHAYCRGSMERWHIYSGQCHRVKRSRNRHGHAHLR